MGNSHGLFRYFNESDSANANIKKLLCSILFFSSCNFEDTETPKK